MTYTTVIKHMNNFNRSNLYRQAHTADKILSMIMQNAQEEPDTLSAHAYTIKSKVTVALIDVETGVQMPCFYEVNVTAAARLVALSFCAIRLTRGVV